MEMKAGLKMAMMHSFLLTRGYEKHYYTDEDIINMSNPSVSECQINLYIKVIKMLAEAKSYDEIYEFIDAYTGEDYDKLEENQKTYIKSRLRKDLVNRKNSLKGEDNNE